MYSRSSVSGGNSLKQFYDELVVYNYPGKNRNDSVNKRSLPNSKKNIKLPSIYHSNKQNQANKSYRLNNKLMQRIQTFHNRIDGLEMEKQVQNRANKRFQQLIKQKKSYQSRVKIPLQHFEPLYYTPVHSPLKNSPINIPRRYNENPNFQQSPFQHPNLQQYFQGQPYLPNNISPHQMKNYDTSSLMQKNKIEGSKLRNINYKRKFKIAALAVYFSIIFPKFSRTVTLLKRKKFLTKWQHQNKAKRQKRTIYQLFKKQIEIKAFKENKEGFVQNWKEHKKPKEKVQSKKKIHLSIKLDEIFEFIDKLADCIISVMESKKFQKFIPYLGHFLPMQFVHNYIFDQDDLQLMNLHKQKGYSRHQKKAAIFLLAKHLIYENIQKNKIISIVGEQYCRQNYPEQIFEGCLYSLYIRSSIYLKLTNSLLQQLSHGIKQFSLPAQKLQPIPLDPQQINQSIISLQTYQRNIEVNQKYLMKILEKDEQGKQIKSKFINTINKLYLKIEEHNKKVLKEMKESALSAPFLKSDFEIFNNQNEDESSTSDYSTSEQNDEQQSSSQEQQESEEKESNNSTNK